ncbi:MAG: CDP-alcohol phosphatidyltransferase family protein [bacterium]
MVKKFTVSNLITIFRFVLLPFIIFFLIKKERFIAFIMMLGALFSDVVDGYIARKFHQETELGKLLDPLCDKISLVVILITLLRINSIPLWAVFIIALRDVLILLGSFVLFKKRRLVYKSNFFGKLTGFLFGTMILTFTLNLQRLGMIFLYIAIPIMTIAFISYLHRYITNVQQTQGLEARN